MIRCDDNEQKRQAEGNTGLFLDTEFRVNQPHVKITLHACRERHTAVHSHRINTLAGSIA